MKNNQLPPKDKQDIKGVEVVGNMEADHLPPPTSTTP